MISQKSKESKISRCLKAPIRVLTKARNYYIKSMSQCAGGIGFAGGPMGCPTPHVSSMPKSFSVNSSRSMSNDEDFRELVRIASARRLGKKVEMEILQRRQSQSSAAGVGMVPRSQSVAIGRIEEDKEYEIGDEYLKEYPRSRSCAVDKRNNIDVDELEQERKSSSSNGDEDEYGSQKLTRAKRKRLHKKKLSEATLFRRKVIKPLLPTTSFDGNKEGDDKCPRK